MKKLFLGALLMGAYLTGCGCVRDNSSISDKVSSKISSITNTVSTKISSIVSSTNTDQTSSIMDSVITDVSSMFNR